MLQSMGSQRVGHDLETKKQQQGVLCLLCHSVKILNDLRR